MTISRRAAMAAVLAGMVAGGCAHAARGAAAHEVTASLLQGDEGPAVEVHNRFWQEVNVYLYVGGQRARLGSVMSNRSARFSIARFGGWDSHSLRLNVDPIGTPESYTTEDFSLSPGQWAECNVEGTLQFSNYAVRNY